MRKEGGKAKKKRGKNSAEKPEAGGRGEAAERKRPNRKRKRAGVRMPADRTSDGRRAIKRNKKSSAFRRSQRSFCKDEMSGDQQVDKVDDAQHPAPDHEQEEKKYDDVHHAAYYTHMTRPTSDPV